MCGIVGAAARRPVAELLIAGRRRLEYRGYASAGLAVLHMGQLSGCQDDGAVAVLAVRVDGAQWPGH